MTKRARDFCLPFEGTPGPLNHICDVKGIEVGHDQVISKKAEKKGPGIRTGVSVIFPRPKTSRSFRVPAGVFVFNGNGEFTGLHLIEEKGYLEGPIAFTGTFSVGLVSQVLRLWMRQQYPELDHKDIFMGLPVVAETYDGLLHAVDADSLKKEHVVTALKKAHSKNVLEGDIGGGSGMMSFGFKSGIGSSSRIVKCLSQKFTLGALVQSNFGKREDLSLFGRALGVETQNDFLPNFIKNKDGSLLVALATDAPLSPRQLKRIAKRSSLAMGLLGSKGRDSSGDFFLCFSTKSPKLNSKGFEEWQIPPDSELDPFFEAAIQATHEAILNSLIASKDVVSGDRKIFALPHSLLK